MATIANQYNEDDENNENGSTVNINDTGGGTDTGTGQGGAAAPVSNVQQNAAAQNQSGYTDVASYLNANQGGSQKLGEQVASNLGNKYNTTKQGVTDSADKFNSAVDQGYVKQNSDLINEVASNPLAAVSDPSKVSAYQAQLNNTYKGPTSWDDLGTQRGKVNEANQYASLADTPGGLNIYTQEAEAQTGGPMSQGINQLDTLLLGGTPGAIGQVKTEASKYKDLNDYINQMNTAGMGNVANAQNAAKTGSQAALDAFTGANGTLTNLNNTVTNNASTALQQAQAKQEALKQALGGIYNQPVDSSTATLAGYGGSSSPWYNSTNYNVNDTMNPDTLAELGISQDQWNALRTAMQQAGTSEYKTGHNFGAASPTAQIDLNEFLASQDPTQAITASTVATPEQYQQMAAIQQLLGGKTPQNLALNPLNASVAGTAPKSSTQFDYQGALDYANQVAKAERDAAQEAATGLTAQADLSHAQSQHGGGFLNKLKDVAGKTFPLHKIANETALNLGKKAVK